MTDARQPQLSLMASTFHDASVGTFPRGPDGKTPQYPQRFCDWMNVIDPHDCGCEWMAPYGFVIEAGCPEHD